MEMIEIENLYCENFHSDDSTVIEEKLNALADTVLMQSDKLSLAKELGEIIIFAVLKTEENKYRLSFILKNCKISSPMLIELLDDRISILSLGYEYEENGMSESSIRKAIEVYSITQKVVLRHKRIAEHSTVMSIKITSEAKTKKVVVLIRELMEEIIS